MFVFESDSGRTPPPPRASQAASCVRCPHSMTNGGKTTLTNSLLKVLPNCCVIHQDDFFKVGVLTGELGAGEPAQATLTFAACCPCEPGKDPSQVSLGQESEG